MTVIVVGDIVTDILAVYKGQIAVGSDTAADISITGGGSAANTAAWLASLGCPVALVGVAGTDSAGDQRLAELAAAGVDTTAVRRSADAPTGSVIVLAHTEERSMFCDRGANLLLEPSDVDAAMVRPAAHVHVSGYTLLDGASLAAGRHALETARGHGLTTSVDAASAAPLRRVTGAAFLQWIRGVDILFANEAEARALLSDDSDSVDPVDLARALARHAGQAVVKLGERGAVWASGGEVASGEVAPGGVASGQVASGEVAPGEVLRVAATPAAAVVDPTGAGDAFAAGFLTALLGGAAPRQALRAGADAGARAVAHRGGRPPSV